MPIYEYYCSDCNTIFSFFSKLISPDKKPCCPKCGKKDLERQISAFAMTGGRKTETGDADLPVDESKMESAMMSLAGEAENIDENDPAQAARLMRKFSSMTGVKFGKGMEEAIGRMEAGEDPEKIESEMDDLMEGEEPFLMPGDSCVGSGGRKNKKELPRRDNTFYEL